MPWGCSIEEASAGKTLPKLQHNWEPVFSSSIQGQISNEIVQITWSLVLLRLFKNAIHLFCMYDMYMCECVQRATCRIRSSVSAVRSGIEHSSSGLMAVQPAELPSWPSLAFFKKKLIFGVFWWGRPLSSDWFPFLFPRYSCVCSALCCWWLQNCGHIFAGTHSWDAFLLSFFSSVWHGIGCIYIRY